MDYHDERCQTWNWNGKDNCPQKQSDFPDLQECMVTLNEEDHSYMFDEATPVKACGDLAYQIVSDNTAKESEEGRETCSSIKRRRMLQFDTQVGNPSPFSTGNSLAILNSNNGEDPFDEILPEGSHLIPGFSEDVSASGYENIDLSSEEWFSECFTDPMMQYSPDAMNFLGDSDVQIDVSEFLTDIPPESDANPVRHHVPRTPPNVIFKGKKSFIRAPSTLPSSVAYPFAFIKPCGFHGDVTLKDINQRIRNPPPPKLKRTEEALTVYQTSAFSGKPVVGKTKIRTEGGKGSITIMRTKG